MWMGRKGRRGWQGAPMLGAEVGPCWVGVGVGVPSAGEAVEEPWKVEVVGTPLEVAKCLGVAPGLGLGEVGG